MDDIAKTFILLGSLLLLGLATDAIGRRTRLPRVTLMLLFGIAIGPVGLGFLSTDDGKFLPIVTDMALMMIGFLLGEKFVFSSLRRYGKTVLWVSAAEVAVTAVAVLCGLLALGARLEVALLLAGIATSTAPAATIDVVNEMHADGNCTRTLLGIVAVDDAWGLIVFSLMLTIIDVMNGLGNSLGTLLAGGWEIGGALLLGFVLGAPMAYVTGRIKPGEPTMVEALGVVFLCGGVAIWLHVSHLLACMVLGSVVANLARHHTRPFHAIENIEWPFMILFFLLAGASLQVDRLGDIGLIGAAYVVMRIVGRFLGGWLGASQSDGTPEFKRWIGLALMPQAGVALGMVLVAVQRHPDLKTVLVPVVVGATVLFEVLGPILTRGALLRWGEAGGSHRKRG